TAISATIRPLLPPFRSAARYRETSSPENVALWKKDRRTSGSGLGLSIVDAIMKRLGVSRDRATSTISGTRIRRSISGSPSRQASMKAWTTGQVSVAGSVSLTSSI
ncbi:ATP-binding protein, partial [Bosea sp. AAP35]|uniref:ATP-binding protein n=1 Tax=Bosea sp. AAP35 TaxID=1523417 RepID=UPI001AEC7122